MKKNSRELDIFQAFVADSCLPIESASITHRPEPEPDILCTFARDAHYFELSEILWEPPGARGESLVKGMANSAKAAKRRAQGTTGAPTIGGFGYPPLLSLKQSLERKTSKSYTLHNHPCSLLLFYDWQTPVEPFDLLFECAEMLTALIANSVFETVWLYAYAASNSISIRLDQPEFEGLAGGVSVPLSSWSTADQTGSVVGRISLRKAGGLTMSFDARYSAIFRAALGRA